MYMLHGGQNMPQLHFSVSEETAQRLRLEAKSRGLPVSRLLAEIVERQLGAGWPAGYLEGILQRASEGPDFELPVIPKGRLEEEPPAIG